MHIPIQNPSDDKNRWAETVSNNLPTESASSSSLNNKVFEDILYEVSIVQLAPKQGSTTLPSLSARDIEESVTSAFDNIPRTPGGTPRTPRTPLMSLLDEEAIIKKRRNEFFVYDLLMEINFNNIVIMKKAFETAGGGVPIADFVKIMKQAVPHQKENENNIISRLTDLFTEIDIDGDKELSWEEFTSFIIKSGVEPFDPTKSMKQYQEIHLRNEITWSGLTKIKYFPQLDKLVVCESNKDKTVRVYKPENIKFQTEYSLYKELKHHTGAILTAEYIDTRKYLVTSGADCCLFFWDTEAAWRRKAEGTAPVPQTALLWHKAQGTLFTGGIDGNIHLWSEVFTEKDKSYSRWKIRQTYRSHTDMITSMVLIPNTPIMVAGSLDSNITTWDTYSGIKQKDLKGHVKGVNALTYSHEHRFLISAGSDRDALVWNPMVKNRPIFRLKGHHTSLISVETVEGTPQILTGDLDGFFRLWDIRSFECTQTFEPSIPIGELLSFCCTGVHNQIIAAGNRMVVYEYDKPGTPWLTMQNPIVTAIYNNASSTILTAGGTTIKIWDAKTGRLLRIYNNVCEGNNSSISAVSLDDGQKKIVVGDTDGNVLVLNYSNGALLRKLDTRNIITSSWDATVNIHDELDGLKKGRSVVRTMSGHKKDVVCTSYAEGLNLVANGTADGIVWVWDFEKCTSEGKLEHNSEEITALAFLLPYPLLCTADNTGQFYFWLVKPNPSKNNLLLSFKNTLNENNKALVVSSLVWAKEEKLLYAGDESGVITIWDPSKLLQRDVLSMSRMRSNSRATSIRSSTVPGEGERVLNTSAYKPITKFDAVESDVVLVKKWQAHYTVITTLDLIVMPPALMSASKDKRVRMWDRNGDYYGSLRQAEGTVRTWSFPLDDELRRQTEARKVEEIQNLLDKKENRKLRRIKSSASSSSAITLNESVSNRKEEEEMTNTILDLLPNEELYNTRTLASLSDKVMNSPLVDDPLLSDRSDSRPTSSASPQLRMKLKKSKFANNAFYQTTQSRMRTGDPDLDKFNPRGFPILIPGLPLPELRMSQMPVHLPTKSRSPLEDEPGPQSFFDLLKFSHADRNMNSTQISLAKKLSDSLDRLDWEH